MIRQHTSAIAGEEKTSRKGEEARALTPLQKRARAKFVGLGIIMALLTLTDSPLRKSYRNSYYCSHTLQQRSGRITSKRCGNRWCLDCNRIRTAIAIDRYEPVIKSWGDEATFVTLTIRNCTAEELPGHIRLMRDTAVRIVRAIQRSSHLAIPFAGLRKLECTHSPRALRGGEYHPHFHFVVNSRAGAQELVRRWLAAFPADVADPKAQNCRPLTAVREVFKYFTKMFARTHGKKGRREMVPPAALDVMFQAMRGLRVYQPIGFRVVKADEEAELEELEGAAATIRPDEDLDWKWDRDLGDWVDQDTGEVLASYEPSPRVRGIIAFITLTVLRERQAVA